MEEEDLDYGTPIGALIKHINTICKKPQIDEKLSEALDVFNEKLQEQELYLINGIFTINFSEAALFLQSSVELYKKKIDLLWDQLLDFHTTIITYDCEHQQQHGGPINKKAIEKLEERRNRYKRKKDFKVILKPIESDVLKGLVLHGESQVKSNLPVYDDTCAKMWKELELNTKKLKEDSDFIFEHMTQGYGFKSYVHKKKGEREATPWDINEGDFDAKYKRIPGWHHIEQLFEYNDKGLLADDNKIIARLRLRSYGKFKFLWSKKIPATSPFETYKEEYLAYRNKFFEEEAKRWQNMPLNTIEDFHKQIEYIKYKDVDEIRCVFTSNPYCRLDHLSVKNCQPDVRSDKIEILDNSDTDDDSLFELSFSCDNEFTQSPLFVRLEKLSTDIINTNTRQDSGFFDFNDNDSDCQNENISETDDNPEQTCQTNENEVSTACKDNAKITCSANETNVDVSSLVNENSNSNFAEPTTEEVTDDNAHENDSFETRSYVSDHDYCLSIAPCIDENVLCTDVNKNTSMENNNLKVGSTKDDKDLNKTVEKTMEVPFCGQSRIIPKIVKIKEQVKRKINKESRINETPSKIRKLSEKQIEKLLKSKINPVKELKFENFFSLNYQPQLGEGDIFTVEYESEESDTENEPPEPHQTDLNDSRSEHGDVRSVHDHDYCLPSNDEVDDDLEVLNTETEPASEKTHTSSSLLNYDDINFNFEEEYQRQLALLKDSQTTSNETVQEEITPAQKEMKELQARVDEWRSTINPILDNLKEKDFDIHEYGSQIMDGMEINQSKPFNNIVGGKSSAEVVRFFISSLQLANTNNIEICGAKPGELSNDTYTVKLLSKDRYHEHLTEFLAPSKEDLSKKLKRAREVIASKANSGEPKAKKLKWPEMSKNDGNKQRRMTCVSYKRKSATNAKNYLPQEESMETGEPLPVIKECQIILIPIETSLNSKKCTDDSQQILAKPQNVLKGKSLVKGKTIVKRQVKQYILNGDSSKSSTSRCKPWWETSSQDQEMPSTSYEIPSPIDPPSASYTRMLERTEELSVSEEPGPSHKSADVQQPSSPFRFSYRPLMSSTPSARTVLFK